MYLPTKHTGKSKMITTFEALNKISKKAAQTYAFISNNGENTSITEISAYLSVTKVIARKLVSEIRSQPGLAIEVFNDINGTYGDRTRGHKFSV